MGQGGRGPWPHTADPGPGTGQESRSTGGRGRLGLAGTAWYAITCILAALTLTASGFTYFVVRDVSSIGRSHAISSGPSIGAQNILLMGLESRRDWNGNILPTRILAKLHAGNRAAVANGTGGNATNTLILIHIFAGGKRAIGFSIPRDDWVTFADTVGPQQAGKIDQAYGVSMYYEQARLRQEHPAMGQDELAFLGNEAGRRAAVATVEQLTGVHVDHFAEVNLDGFYELARVFGGVEVCLRHPVHDVNSGANFPAGYQHLDAAQALAFVRQRDGLPNGDLDRTHRQQAFLDSVMHQLRTEGVLSDLTKIAALISVARQYVITDSGWNLLDFAAQARDLSAGNMVFHTLPIKGYATIDGQDANVVDVGYIRALVKAAFYPPPQPARRQHGAGASPHGITVDVLNGGDTAWPGRAYLGRAGPAGVPGGPGGQHGVPGHHGGPVRPGRGRQRRRPGPAVRRQRHPGRLGARPARGDPARHLRRPAGQPQLRRATGAGLGHPDGRAAGRRGTRQGRHPLRELAGLN